jgi:predicted nucleic acid-binding protein
MYKYGSAADGVFRLPVLNFTKEDAQLAAKLEFELEKKGNKIDRADSMIAAIAINKNAELYTFNTKHFKGFEVFGLKLF